MLARLFAPPVEFVALQDRVLTFRSPRALPAGPTVRVRLSSLEGRSQVCVKVRLASFRCVPGGFVYTGWLLVQGSAQLPEGCRAEVDEPFLRRQERQPWRTLVVSQDLPGFRALSVDLSLGGMQLETEGPLTVGSVIDVHLDREVDGPLVLSARVAWCQSLGPRRSRAGVEFQSLPEGARKRLASLYDELTQRDSMSVSERLLRSHRLGVDSGWEAPDAVPGRLVPLDGNLESYGVSGREVFLQVRDPRGERLELLVSGLEWLADHRGRSGTQLGRVEERNTPAGRRHYRLLNPLGHPVLELHAESLRGLVEPEPYEARPRLRTGPIKLD